MALYVLALLAVLVLGWRRPVRGSAIAMLAAAGMTLFVVLTKSGRDMIVPLLITVAPTLIVSGTFLLAGRKESTGDDRKP